MNDQDLLKKQAEAYNAKKLSQKAQCIRMNRKVMTNALKKYFKILGRKFPKYIIFVRSPFEAQQVMNYLDFNDFKSSIATHSQQNNLRWVKNAVNEWESIPKNNLKFYPDSNFENWLVYFCDFYRNTHATNYTTEQDIQLDTLLTIDKYTKWLYLFNEVIVVVTNPVSMKLNGKIPVSVTYADGVTVNTQNNF